MNSIKDKELINEEIKEEQSLSLAHFLKIAVTAKHKLKFKLTKFLSE